MRKLAVALAVLLLVSLAPADEDRRVRTSREAARVLPLPKEEGSFHFLIFGDRTGGPPEGIDVLKQAVRDANLLGPDLVMTVGDLVQGYNARADWLRQTKEFRGVMGGLSMAWFPTPGNHDIYWRGGISPPGQHEGDYEKHFGPLWYWFPHKNAAFVVLYTDEGDPKTGRKGWGRPELVRFSDRQLAWLEKTLAETAGYDHVFLFMHHPRWIGGYYRGTNWDRVHPLLVKAGNVTACFAGHIHRMRYDGKRDGIEYFALATTGGGIPMNAPGTGWLHHMNLVSVRKEGITVATLPVGAVLDPREMTPEHLAEIDLVRNLPRTLVSGLVPIRTDGAAGGAVRYRLTNPASRPVEVTATLDVKDRSWRIHPDHVHFVLEPGKSADAEFKVGRPANGFLADFRVPDVVLDVDYLGEARRVTLPPQRRPVDLVLTGFTSEPGTQERRAIHLDGRRTALRVRPDAIDLPDGPLTLEAWVRPTAPNREGAVAGKLESSEYGLLIRKGTPSFSVHLGGSYTTVRAAGPKLAAGEWVHLAGVFDGKEIRIYVNGRRAGRKKASGPRTLNGYPLYVGAEPDRRGNPSRHFLGALDEVRLSKTARYAGDAFTPENRHEPDPDTVLLLHLDRSFGPFVPDHSPSAAHARTVGNPSFRAERR